jgi:signal transduction histidine kinase
MDPFFIIKTLNVAVLVIFGGALYVFWRSSGRDNPFLLYWSVYEFTMAAVVALVSYQFLSTLAIGIAVPVLLLGILRYGDKRQPPRSAFVLLFLVIVVPDYALTLFVGEAQAVTYVTATIAIAELAAAALFFREGGALNIFIGTAFAGRGANVLLFPLWTTPELISSSFAVGQILVVASGTGMLMAGFAKAYGRLQTREQELVEAYNNSGELMRRLERRNQEYLEARRSAEAANAAKSQFLANMSHELRTPLNAILGFSEMLALLPKQKAVDKLDSYTRNIHDAASGLQVIINDILNLSRIEAGALDIEQSTFDVSEMLGDILRILRPLADQKDISLINRTDKPCPMRGDSRLTKQALINGVSNAIKYTPRGGEVTCSTWQEDGFGVASVEDNGIGIEEARLAKVFEPFWQEGNCFVAENTGVGLGLTIARSYVEAQGGRIEIKRAGERGTIFRIYLPAAEAVQETAPPARALGE